MPATDLFRDRDRVLPSENKLDPIPEESGTLRSEPRLRTLFGLLLAADAASAEELDLWARADETLAAVGRCRARGKANLDEDVGECSTEATPAGGDWVAMAV